MCFFFQGLRHKKMVQRLFISQSLWYDASYDERERDSKKRICRSVLFQVVFFLSLLQIYCIRLLTFNPVHSLMSSSCFEC